MHETLIVVVFLVFLFLIVVLLLFLISAVRSLAAALGPQQPQQPQPPQQRPQPQQSPAATPPREEFDPEETGLDAEWPGEEEKEGERSPIKIKLLGLNRKITGYVSNYLGSSTYLSQIEWSYAEPREHELIFVFKKIRGLWAETVSGKAVVFLNSDVLLSRYSAAYDAGRQELIVSFLDGRNKQLKASGRVSLKMTLGDNDRVIQISGTPESQSGPSAWDSASDSSDASMSFSRGEPRRPIQPYTPPKLSRIDQGKISQGNFMCR